MVGGWDELYAKAGMLGIDLVLLHTPDKLAPLEERGVPSHMRLVDVDISDVDACVAAAERLHVRASFGAAVSFTEWGLESAAAIVERLGPQGVQGNPARPVRLTRDKLAMRDVLAGAGIPTIPYRRCSGPADVLEFQRSLGQPVIVKPAKGAGSAGVTLLRSGDAQAAWSAAVSEAATGGVIAEAFIPGDEFSVDTMSYDGAHEVVAIAEKITTGPPHFVELGHQVPARLDPGAQALIAEVVTAFLDLIGQRHGPAHTEFKLVDGAVVIIESQTRTGGDQIWELNRLATGYDLHLATMRYLLTGRRGACSPAAQNATYRGPLGAQSGSASRGRRAGAAVRFFSADPGTIVAIEGMERAAACRAVHRFELNVCVGDRVAPLTSSAARLGYVVCVAATIEEAIALSEEACRQVRITTQS
jgi:biotin carboxylase